MTSIVSGKRSSPGGTRAMETSIADATSLRIRSSLQCAGLRHGKQQGQGVFEELLKLPAQKLTDDRASSWDSYDFDEPVADQMAPSNEPKRPMGAADDSSENSGDEASAKNQELAAQSETATNCLMAVCPPPPQTPIEAEPTPSTGEPVTNALPKVQVAEEAAPVELAPSITNETAEVAPVAAVDTAPQTIDETQTQTFESTNIEQATVSQRADEPSRLRVDNKSPGDVEHHVEAVKSAQPADRSQDSYAVQGKPDALQQPERSIGNEPAVDKPIATDRDDRVDRYERGEQREKWYEAKDKDAIAATTSDHDPHDATDQQSHAGEDSRSIAVDVKDQGNTSNGFDLNAMGFDLSVNTQTLAPSADELAAMASALAAMGSSTQGWSSSGSPGSGSNGNNQSSAIEAAAGRTAGINAASGNGLQATGSVATSIGPNSSSLASGSGSSAASGKQAGDKAGSDSDVRQLTQQERVRLVQRVARSFSRLGPDGGQVTLKLHPPQLGVLNVSIRLEGQTMSAKLQTESSAAREVILDNLPQLRDRLAEQGIEVEKFQVDVASSSDMSAGGQTSSSSDNSSASERDGSSMSTSIDYRRASRIAVEQNERRSLGTVHPLNNSSLVDRSLDLRV